MNRPSIRLSAALLAAVFLAACGDSGTGPDPNRVEAVRITPDDPAIFVGDAIELQATALNSAGGTVTGKTATWSSSSPGVATVSQTGLLTGVGGGTSTITATIDGKAGAVTVTVTVTGTKPTVNGVSPSPMVPGSAATLNGQDLTATTQVFVNGVRAAVITGSGTSVQFTVPCVAPGAATIVARNGTANSDAFDATVNATSSAPMAVGDFRTLSGSPCLQLPAAGNQTYLIGVQSVSEDGTSLTPVTFGIDAAGAVADVVAGASLFRTGPARAAIEPTRTANADAARMRAHREAELDLRARDLASTAHLIAAGAGRTAIATAKTTTAAAVPNVGDIVNMRFPDVSGVANALCTQYVGVTGRVAHISNRAIFVADTANPTGGFTAADYTHFGSVFDDSIYEPQVTYFGAPTDLDDNQRIIVLLTKEVNKRPNILGMVVSADFFPRTTCASSDYGEIYYSRVPDPNGDYGAAYSVADARLDVPALIAHEMTHIIQFGRRGQVSGARDYQALWEMESQATLAEEVIGHRFKQLQTRQNYGFDVAWDNCPTSQNPNPVGIAWYCDKFQDLALYYGFQSQTTRATGAPEQCTFVAHMNDTPGVPCRGDRQVYTGWSFLRWLSDHYGDALGGEGQLHRRLIDNTIGGFASITGIVGRPIDELLGQWAATLYTDDRYVGVGGLLTLPSWNLYDIEQGLVATARLAPYQHTFSDASRDVSVRGGSSAYFLVTGSRPATAIRATTQTGGALPSNARMWIARVQ